MFNATPLLRLYSRYRSAQLRSYTDFAALQEKILLSLVRTARDTKFGRQHHFERIRSVKDFQTHVPLRRYEAFWDEYFKNSFPHIAGTTWPNQSPYFPVSSGTSAGTTKFLPYSHEMIRSNSKAGLDLLVHHLNARPTSQIFGGASFVLGGSTDFVARGDSFFSGDLSGIAAKTLPWWARSRFFPSDELALLSDWDEKIQRMAEASLKRDIRTLSGVPNWILLLVDRLCKLVPSAEGRLSRIYPNLEMLVHGGVNFAPYRDQFSSLLEGSKAELREVYPASEGFIGIADRAPGEGLRLNLDHGIFYEFVPFDELTSDSPTRHTLDTIELDVNYAIVLSTCAGLWSYIIGDTVRFIDRSPPRVLITGRTSYYLSAFGEHLIAEEIEDAVVQAAQAIGSSVSDFSVGPLFPKKPSDRVGHIYVVEFAHPPSPEQISQFSKKVDQVLCQRNEDYAAHRVGDFGAQAPTVIAVQRGTFSSWMKSRGKLGGQNKVPRIITNEDLLDSLIQSAQHSACGTS